MRSKSESSLGGSGKGIEQANSTTEARVPKKAPPIGNPFHEMNVEDPLLFNFNADDVAEIVSGGNVQSMDLAPLN